MKKFFLLIPILLLILFTACESDTPPLPSDNKTLAGNISSRSNTTERLGEGSQILLNATGGITIKNQLFTYNNGSWRNENGHQWGEAEATTSIIALYPHDATPPYNGDALKDVLIAQATLSQGDTDITLTFKHLFASFTLNVDETLVDEILEIQLTSPQKVASILPTTGEVTLTESANTTILTGNGSDSYTFIIPPMEASLALGITLSNGKSQTYTLQRHCFEGGVIYECRLRDWNTVPGIRSKDDFIAFSQLINGKSYGTYKLSDFGEKQADDRMLYRLLADIDLKEVSILPVGYNNSSSIIFSDIFDGQGHTISNLTIPDKSTNSQVYKNYSGLFGYIGTKGIVKNLHIIGSKTVTSTQCTYIGGLAAKNEGTIINCSVQSAQLNYYNEEIETGIRIGGICASMTNGKIINCHSTGNTISTNKSGAVGGIIGDSCGDILNCYAYDNKFNVPDGSYAGGIIGTVSTTSNFNIANCYVLHYKAPKNWGAIIGLIQQNKMTLDNIFYNGGSITASNSSFNNPNIYKYQQYCVEKDGQNRHISVYLNEWIDTTGKNIKYQNITFNKWIKAETSPHQAIFK